MRKAWSICPFGLRVAISSSMPPACGRSFRSRGLDRYAVPVIDLRKRLGLPGVVLWPAALLVVVESDISESGLAGFVVDYVSDLIEGSPEDCRGGKLRVEAARNGCWTRTR